MKDKGDTDTRNSRLFHFLPKSFLWRAILALVVFALLTDVVAFCSGLNGPVFSTAAPEGYKRFIEVPAWWPFPVYFILVAFVIWQSWDAFNTAWRSLPHTGVIQRCDLKKLEDADAAMDNVIANFESWRKWVLIPVAFAAGFTSMYMDSERERATMMATIFGTGISACSGHEDRFNCMQTTFSGQVARACEAPDFQSKWLWEELAKTGMSGKQACNLAHRESADSPDKSVLISNTRHKQYQERVKIIHDYVVKHRSEGDTYLPAPPGQLVTEVMMHLQDMILISLGCLIFLQCVAHAIFFWNFERLPAAKLKGGELCLGLNYKSYLGEFGLEHMNHALNNLYWYFSGALIIPFLSRISQPDLNDLDKSQLMLQYAIPILVATPMISTILARQSRLPACWDSHSPDDMKLYLSQRLWPLDKNWSSKLGILLAFVLLSISFGINMTTLFK